MRYINCIVLAFLFALAPLSAQDFGFGNDGGDNASGGKSVNVTVGGEVSASLLGYIDDFSKGRDHIDFGEIFSGKLNFSAETPFADGVINLKIQTTEQPVSVDEAYVRAYFGALEIEGGLRKLTWGKADSFGPLDVINPLDYSELTDLSDPMNLKIARPLIHASIRIGSFSKLEGVFVPTFEPLRYAAEGRWVPAQMAELNKLSTLVDNLPEGLLPPELLADFKVDINQPDTSKLEYFQAGARFTTTIGPADFGLQYYFGRLTRPVPTYTFTMPPDKISAAINFDYNTYHQIGIDWAQALLGFNIRAEFAANITRDLSGEDPSIYNPALLWSFGFDRDLFLGLNLNVQCNESIRLMHNKIKNDKLSFGIPLELDLPPLDIEAGTDKTSTQIIAVLSRKFFRDELELRFASIWEIEAKDYLLMPAVILTKDTVSVEFSGGIFGGKKEGQFGQYHNNNFVKVSLTYSF